MKHSINLFLIQFLLCFIYWCEENKILKVCHNIYPLQLTDSYYVHCGQVSYPLIHAALFSSPPDVLNVNKYKNQVVLDDLYDN